MIVQHIRNWIAAGEPTIMDELAGGADKITTVILERAFEKGDPMAAKPLGQMSRWLGVWFFNLYLSYNVNCFVYGGGLVNMGEKLLGPIRRAFDSYNHDERPVYFKTAQCAGDSGIIGASELVYSALEK